MADKPAVTSKLQAYYWLMKPGIIYGNLLSAAAGFLLAAGRHVYPGTFLASMIGLAAIIGGSCVGNNLMDRRIDKLMKRTQKRALVTGAIPAGHALVFCFGLFLLGIFLFGMFVNLLSLSVALFGAFAYLVLYGYGKRKTVHGTLIGSISGAIPPVVGYTAVTGRLDLGALLLFLVLVVWQMPHFYSIALFRADDYKAANIPVLSVVHGSRATRMQIYSYVVAFMVAVSLLTLFGYTGLVYLLGVLVASGYWLYTGYKNRSIASDVVWGRKLFGASLMVLLAWSVLTAASPWLP